MKQHPKIKICGLTRECDMEYINEAAPDYIGFVFAKSRRQITGGQARILRQQTAEGIQAVGVFADAEFEIVERLVQCGTIDIVQLHGAESPFYAEKIKKRTGAAVMKAICMRENSIPAYALKDYESAGVDYFLFDGGSGNGIAFDWSRIPRTSCPYFLAGGLHVGNVEAAIRETEAYALDMSSGVETNGVKDRDKILEVIRRIRNV